MTNDIEPSGNGGKLESPRIPDKLSDTQKRRALDIMVSLIQGKLSTGDMQESIMIIHNMRKHDEEGYLDLIADAMMLNEDIVKDPDLVLKMFGLNIKWHDIKHRKKYVDAATERSSIASLNELRKLSKATDGVRFGDKKQTQIIDVSSVVEGRESPRMEEEE